MKVNGLLSGKTICTYFGYACIQAIKHANMRNKTISDKPHRQNETCIGDHLNKHNFLKNHVSTES